MHHSKAKCRPTCNVVPEKARRAVVRGKTKEDADMQRPCDLANDTAGWTKRIEDAFPTKKNNDTEPPN